MKLNIDFAFEGFRIIRQKPSLILFWGAVLLFINLISTAALITFAGPSMQALSDMQTAPPSNDPAQALALMQNLIPIYAVAIPFGIMMQAVLSCAVYRCVLGDKNAGFGFLRLGGAEFLQIGLYILFFLLMIPVVLASIVAGGIVGVVLSAVLGLLSPALAAVGVFAGVILAYGVMFWLMIRLSLAPVQTFDQKKLNLFGSWKLTGGNAWTLFFGYLIMIVMILLVLILCLGIFSAVVIGVSGGDFNAMSQVFGSPMASWEDFSNPIVIVYLLVMNLIVSPLILALSTGAPAAAYKQLVGFTSGDADKVF